MLENLTIKDFAIIDEVSIDFSKGFTVLTGETGAGKSILIGAMTFVLGGVATVQSIKAGSDASQVSATFSIKGNNSAKSFLDEQGIDFDDDEAILRRVIKASGKSSAWINGVAVTRGVLSEFSNFLIDIHGQHEHQSLLKVSEHRKALDARAAITSEVEDFGALYSSMVKAKKELAALDTDSANRARSLDMANFAINEIESAKLQQDEDATLEAEEKKLSSFERLFEDASEAAGLLSDGASGAEALLKRALKAVERAAGSDEALSEVAKRLESAFYEVSDIAQVVSEYKDGLVFRPERLEAVQERLSAIYALKKKYASNVTAPLSEVFSYLENAKATVQKLSNFEDDKAALQEKVAALEQKVSAEAQVISKKRHDCAKTLSGEVESVLQTLGMKGAKFVVNISNKAALDISQRCNQFGMDDIEFLIAANKGGAPLSLNKVASGGELSRVMLALKSILSKSEAADAGVDTLIFDEIDTGIGGEVAVSVGKHIKALSCVKQVLCITHQASIAVNAFHHAKIEKSTDDKGTHSSVHYVDGDERVKEIARMLSGDEESEHSLLHAKELLEGAQGD